MEHKRTENPCVAGSIPALPSIHFTSENAVNPAFSAARRLKIKVDPDACESANKSLNAPTIPCGFIVGGRALMISGRQVIRSCLTCGAMFTKLGSMIKFGCGKYCSRRCQGKTQVRYTHEGFVAPKGTRKTKRRAQGVLKYGIIKGDVVRSPCCENCGKVGPVDGHHDDYTQPHKVRWLCRSCHMKAHQIKRDRSGTTSTRKGGNG